MCVCMGERIPVFMLVFGVIWGLVFGELLLDVIHDEAHEAPPAQGKLLS